MLRDCSACMFVFISFVHLSGWEVRRFTLEHVQLKLNGQFPLIFFFRVPLNCGCFLPYLVHPRLMLVYEWWMILVLLARHGEMKLNVFITNASDFVRVLKATFYFVKLSSVAWHKFAEIVAVQQFQPCVYWVHWSAVDVTILKRPIYVPQAILPSPSSEQIFPHTELKGHASKCCESQSNMWVRTSGASFFGINLQSIMWVE